ncbi:MAG: hypothetical protein H8E42_01520, partial [Nitrospinae bacterium]|nr:hypothetical protein [Nitrospinota bacterium]
IDLRRVAQEVVEDLSARIEESGGTITLKYLPTIVVSNFMMQQLFQNLLANALKFHRPNVAPKITLDAEKINGHGWTIVVSDNGIGFDDADLAGMLNPFKQLNAKSQFDGMGMGLAICDEIVRAHGGSLAAQSVPGEGTSFLITLPDRSLEMAGGVTNE